MKVIRMLLKNISLNFKSTSVREYFQPSANGLMLNFAGVVAIYCS